jgi:hypothetical protein
MTQEQLDQLEREKAAGTKAQRAYKGYIKNFCQFKRESLFMAFSELPLTAEKEIMEVKRMLFAIDTLDNDILSEIETGRLATISLTKAQEDEKGKEVH